MKEKVKIVVDSINMKFITETGKEIIALEDINFDVKENEFLCIMGPSGCGKTTLINIIASLLKPTFGRVTLDGKMVSKPGPDRTVIFQSDSVFPWMTVEDNIAFSLKCQGKSKDEIKKVVDHYLILVNLNEFRKSWPKQLSGGMKKKVDIARAYVANPEVFLMDEPFGPLDIMNKEYLQEVLRKIWMKEPRTIIFVTHDLEEALYLGDRVIIMTPRPGKIYSIIKPNFPYKRDLTLKTEPEFVNHRKEIREILKKLKY